MNKNLVTILKYMYGLNEVTIDDLMKGTGLGIYKKHMIELVRRLRDMGNIQNKYDHKEMSRRMFKGLPQKYTLTKNGERYTKYISEKQ